MLVFRAPFPALPGFQSKVSFSMNPQAERLFIVHPRYARRLTDVDKNFFYFPPLRVNERSSHGHNSRPAR